MTTAVATPEPELQRLPLQECAYALSIALAAFAAWAWLSSAGVWAALSGLRGALAPQAAGFILLAALSFIVQIAANVAAAAARQAQATNLPKECERARVLMILGGAYNAVSRHHAFSLVGFLSGDMALLIWPLAGALAFYEPAQYWIDEALAHERADRKAKRDAAEQAAADARSERLRRLDDDARQRREASQNAGGTEVVTRLDEHRPRKRRGAQTAAAAVLAASGPMAANAGEIPQGVQAPALVQSEQRPVEARVPSRDEVEDARYQLNLRGVRPSFRTVAAHLCVRKCDIEAVWPKGVPLAFADAA
jgi:hypothetical protein